MMVIGRPGRLGRFAASSYQSWPVDLLDYALIISAFPILRC